MAGRDMAFTFSLLFFSFHTRVAWEISGFDTLGRFSFLRHSERASEPMSDMGVHEYGLDIDLEGLNG